MDSPELPPKPARKRIILSDSSDSESPLVSQKSSKKFEKSARKQAFLTNTLQIKTQLTKKQLPTSLSKYCVNRQQTPTKDNSGNKDKQVDHQKQELSYINDVVKKLKVETPEAHEERKNIIDKIWFLYNF